MSNAEQIARQAMNTAIAEGDEKSFNRASDELAQILDNKTRVVEAPAEVATREFDV